MNKRKLFIGNLNYSVTEGQLRTLLSPYGDVISVKVMVGKGYAFVEMGTEEQAHNIQRRLSETPFEGRNLLIDGVPGKGKTTRRTDSGYSGGRKKRTSFEPERGEGSGIHRVEAYERPPKPGKKIRETGRETRISGKPSPHGEVSVTPPKKYPGKPSPVQNPSNRDNSPRSWQDSQKPSSGSAFRERPGQPETGRKPSQPGHAKYSNSPQPGRKDERKVQDKKSKPVKEKPPKNPHPYQGSKNQRKSVSPPVEPEKTAEKSPETEKRDFLRYWATIAGKKQQ